VWVQLSTGRRPVTCMGGGRSRSYIMTLATNKLRRSFPTWPAQGPLLYPYGTWGSSHRPRCKRNPRNPRRMQLPNPLAVSYKRCRAAVRCVRCAYVPRVHTIYVRLVMMWRIRKREGGVTCVSLGVPPRCDCAIAVRSVCFRMCVVSCHDAGSPTAGLRWGWRYKYN